jgi:hypothetical protein
MWIVFLDGVRRQTTVNFIYMFILISFTVFIEVVFDQKRRNLWVVTAKQAIYILQLAVESNCDLPSMKVIQIGADGLIFIYEMILPPFPVAPCPPLISVHNSPVCNVHSLCCGFYF